MPVTREDLVRFARQAVAGPNRPTYCDNPATFDPHEWVLEALQLAYARGDRDGYNRRAASPEGA